MKISAIRFAICVTFLVFLSSIAAFAQTAKPAAASPDSDQLLKNILTEVRQMRAEMQRANLYSHRSQILLERIKVEQDQSVRLTREVGEARDELDAVRHKIIRGQAEVEESTKMKNAGMMPEKDWKIMKDRLEELQQREQNLLSREAMVSAELDVSKAVLADLNKRLDDLDREISQTPNDADGQPAKKKP
jgi:hypothetical protein